VIVLIHSESGDGLALGLRLQNEGHEVGLFVNKEAAQQAGRGLIYRVEDFITAVDKADLILFDHVTKGSLADLLRSEGHLVLGAGKFQDVMELDRIKAIDIMRAAGVAIPETEVFEDASFERAIAFVERDGGRWVFKACDNIATDKTYVSDDADSMLEYLEHLDETIEEDENKRPQFLLQRVVDGIEVSTERWYGEGRPIYALDNSTFEEKKFLAGGLGPSCGCGGNIVLPHAFFDPGRLRRQTIDRLDRLAAAHGVTGPLDLNTIVAPDGRAYFLEVTARFGYDALQAFVQLWDMPIGETLIAIAEGTDPAIALRDAVGAAIRVSVPPYPTGDPKNCRGERVVDPILDDPQLWPGDVMLDEQERLVLGGVDGVAYIVAGIGGTAESALGMCYRWLAQARLPDRQYRNDLAETLPKRLRDLQRIGYLTERSRRAA